MPICTHEIVFICDIINCCYLSPKLPLRPLDRAKLWKSGEEQELRENRGPNVRAAPNRSNATPGVGVGAGSCLIGESLSCNIGRGSPSDSDVRDGSRNYLCGYRAFLWLWLERTASRGRAARQSEHCHFDQSRAIASSCTRSRR